MVLGIGRPLVEFNGAAKQRFGVGKLALLQPDEPQSINRVEMARIGGEHAVVKLFRLTQLPLCVQCDGALKGSCRTDCPTLHERRYIHGAWPLFRYRQSIELRIF